MVCETGGAGDEGEGGPAQPRRHTRRLVRDDGLRQLASDHCRRRPQSVDISISQLSERIRNKEDVKCTKCFPLFLTIWQTQHPHWLV